MRRGVACEAGRSRGDWTAKTGTTEHSPQVDAQVVLTRYVLLDRRQLLVVDVGVETRGDPTAPRAYGPKEPV